MADQTPNLLLPYIVAAQAQKHATHNEAIRALDALVQLAVASRVVVAPPPAPADGVRYIVPTAATGVWSGQDGKIAAFQDGTWAIYAPAAGWLAWVADENRIYAFNGSDWIVAGGGAASVNPAQLVGVNATADATNRLAVNSAASLFYQDSGGHQQKINKSADTQTASQLYQVGFSGRAEVGLTGDNDFHFKVSPNGASWADALVLKAATGTPRVPPFAVNGLPPAAVAGAGAIVHVTNDIDGAVIAFSDGVAWRRVTDRALIAAGATLPFIIVTGESNAPGFALNSDASASDLAVRASVQIYNNASGVFEALHVGVNANIGQGFDNTTHGIEIGLANTTDAGRFGFNPIYLVKSGQAGSTIAQWLPGTTNWTNFLTRINGAKALLAASGIAYTPYVFYTQGINDFNTAVPVATWQAATIAHFADIRGLLGATTRIIISKLPSPQFDSYNAAIDQIVAADAYSTAVVTSDAPLRDSFHWNYTGWKLIAERVVDEIMANAATVAPSASPAPGSYAGVQSVTLTAAGGDVYYTTDGSQPTTGSTKAIGAITLAATTSITAVAVRANYRQSPIASFTYNISTPPIWDTAKKSSAITLSNGNLDAAVSGASAFASVLASVGYSVGKRYFELKVSGFDGANTNFFLGGLATVNASYDTYTGNWTTSLGADGNTTIYRNGMTAGVAQFIGLGGLNDVWRFAVDLDAGKIWMAVNAIGFQNGGDPATGVNPSTTFAAPLTLYPAASLYGPGGATNKLRLLTGAALQYPIPSGFQSW